ncbi:hypothetical protein PHYPSEUDO_014559 [Phytophthora pseudosyringae]|uniref:Uncharacterized protein n=1 Tax=Phytophthora pseudosyringae TaxID=221518 RepID=A0A8T1V7I2_9STRA|nr:hypothetical protein PHYPSEUDO_014559 [Phytophthora pseudosyringae]
MVFPSTTPMTEVHAAWLAAGANEDVAAMRQLRVQFPEWLDFQRVGPVGSAALGSASERQLRFCSWSGFHLRTIGVSALHTAAWGGSLGIVEFLLESGQSPDEGDDSGMTAMMVAILRLNLMTMRCVLRDGEAVRRNTVVDCRKEQDERVALVVAVIKLMLRFGANVDAQSQDGRTALHCATCDDAYEVAKSLLDAGASIDALDENDKTPLHYCVQEEGLLVTDLLLSRGANIDVEDQDGVSPLGFMLQRANVNVLQLFLNHHHWVPTRQRHDFAGAVLLQAVDSREESPLARYVVENEYASVTVQNAVGETPFHRAIVRRSPSMMELLADFDPAGDTLIASTVEFETPAHYAARYGSHREVEMLLQCLTSAFGDLQDVGTANPLNAVDRQGKTSLYIAATTLLEAGGAVERDSKVRLLLHHGARLFPLGALEPKMAPTGDGPGAPRIVLPPQVQSCLLRWVVEAGVRQDAHEEPEDEETAHAGPSNGLVDALTELCVQWMASVACVGSWAALLPILICAGYAHDVVSLLVELPLHRWALPGLLRQLEKFARHQLCHPLLLQLHDELLEAYQAAEMTNA